MNNDKIIDMSQLPPPEVIKVVDYESVLSEMKTDIVTAHPPASAALSLESSTLVKFLERVSYWIMGRSQQENEDAHGVMLAYATGADLDQLGMIYQVSRLVITPADEAVIPPKPAVLESDEALRSRIQLAPKGFSTAGPIDAYVFHALSADGRVFDAYIGSPTSGEVIVTLLSHETNGTASAELIEVVDKALNHDDVRPVTDFVQVQSADIIDYTIEANIHTLSGPDTELVMAEVQKSIESYTKQARAIGVATPLSGIYAALHINGVQRVELLMPTADIAAGPYQAAHCTNIVLHHIEVG